MPYAVQGHIHERGVLTHQQSKASSARSSNKLRALSIVPRVSSWFRGISMTVTTQVSGAPSTEEVTKLYRDYFAGEPFVLGIDEMTRSHDLKLT